MAAALLAALALVTVDARSRPVPVDDAGRITFAVDLGPPGTRQLLSPGTTTRVVTAHVLLD